jgi:hypothetical protein
MITYSIFRPTSHDTPGLYLPKGHVMTCCEAPLALVRRVTKLVRVKP